jgi:polyhydroxybutyrate depolymerase
LVAFLALVVAIAGIVVSDVGTTAAGAASIRNAGVIPSAGCGTSTVRGGETTVSTNSGGVQRDYIRHVPPAHDGVSPRPLVLSIHGLAEGPVIHAATTTWADRADEFGFVVAFPRGIDARWSLTSGSADVVFLTQLLDELEAQLCVDTNRVYMEGYSLGALMTSRLSCTLADRVAAVAPLAGAYAVSGCAPSKSVPLLTFHGTLDTFIPYEPIPG